MIKKSYIIHVPLKTTRMQPDDVSPYFERLSVDMLDAFDEAFETEMDIQWFDFKQEMDEVISERATNEEFYKVGGCVTDAVLKDYMFDFIEGNCYVDVLVTVTFEQDPTTNEEAYEDIKSTLANGLAYLPDTLLDSATCISFKAYETDYNDVYYDYIFRFLYPDLGTIAVLEQ